MKIAKITLAFLALALAAASAFAKNARFDGSQYSISLDYNDSVLPGDPVFIRMRFENIKTKRKNFIQSAKAEIISEDKTIGASDFFLVNDKKGLLDYMAGLPISSWAKNGACKIAVLYQRRQGKIV